MSNSSPLDDTPANNMTPETKSPESNTPPPLQTTPTPPSSMLDQIIATARENSPEPSVGGLSQLPPTS